MKNLVIQSKRFFCNFPSKKPLVLFLACCLSNGFDFVFSFVYRLFFRAAKINLTLSTSDRRCHMPHSSDSYSAHLRSTTESRYNLTCLLLAPSLSCPFILIACAQIPAAYTPILVSCIIKQSKSPFYNQRNDSKKSETSVAWTRGTGAWRGGRFSFAVNGKMCWNKRLITNSGKQTCGQKHDK